MNELKDGIANEIDKEYNDFIKRVKESRHAKTLDRQRSKFNRLCQQPKDGHSKHDNLGNFSRESTMSKATCHLQTSI